MKIKTLVVDDDVNWQKIIGKFVQMHPNLELVGVCGSAMEGYGKMSDVEVDLLICDIEMPEMSGLSFVKSIRHRPFVIFVTAHRDYALDCYEVSPVDFLLKPLELDRFLMAIEKVKERFVNVEETSHVEPYFFVRENSNYIQIAYKDVLYMKAQENYLQIVTKQASYSPIVSISKMEEQLRGEVFMRVHRSYLVHRSAIQAITKNEIVLTSGDSIPIGEQYRNQITRKHIEGNLISRIL
ncbi:LytTR family DNA-binding domain-containing protein [Runella sp. SP2]|uniref:LytR/AlgR family response regulator transcription factor n=1 Tax=Runella sp. SP2 TaxID=2268026 RepID=UPI000F0919F6|nr:LytTR family DNA-binding domain-containing protein [Runella sp. SP2]AYQ31481.1 DNA-binding response regulator [Runella sp. SP2]